MAVIILVILLEPALKVAFSSGTLQFTPTRLAGINQYDFRAKMVGGLAMFPDFFAKKM